MSQSQVLKFRQDWSRFRGYSDKVSVIILSYSVLLMGECWLSKFSHAVVRDAPITRLILQWASRSTTSIFLPNVVLFWGYLLVVVQSCCAQEKRSYVWQKIMFLFKVILLKIFTISPCLYSIHHKVYFVLISVILRSSLYVSGLIAGFGLENLVSQKFLMILNSCWLLIIEHHISGLLLRVLHSI